MQKQLQGRTPHLNSDTWRIRKRREEERQTQISGFELELPGSSAV